MTADATDPIAAALAPLVDLLGRLLTVIEFLAARVDVLELETIYRRETAPRSPVAPNTASAQ